MTSDLDLLGQFTRDHSQDAFTALVNRHVNLVYSAALRQVRSPQLAEEVAQSVFADLARATGKLKPDTLLTAWLYQVTRRTAIDMVRKESRRQWREQIASEMNAMNAHAADSGTGFQPVWTDIEPVLDDAMSALGDTDRAAVLLRYFENKSLREVGQTLGTSEDTAQKRVSRAVERLREFFAKRGVTVGASGLVVVISANAVQAAPIGLAATISTAAALAGTTIATTATATATKAIVMTTLQKTLITATFAVVAGAGIYEARQAATLRSQVQTLQQQQAPLAEQIRQLQQERDDATNRLAGLLAENSRFKTNPHERELLKLRGEVTTLRADVNERAVSDDSLAQMVKSPQMRDFMKTAMASGIDKIYAKLFADLHLTPEQTAALKDLLVKKSGLGMDAGPDLISGKMDAASKAKLFQQIEAEKTGVDAQIKGLLGDEGFAMYQAYDKTYPDRAMILGPAGFEEQLTGGMTLTSDQMEQLIRALAEERQKFKFTVNYADKTRSSAGFASMYSEENIDRYQREQEKLNQLYLARAQTILSPDQLAAFQKFLSGRLEMGVMSLKMSTKMFGPKSGGN